MIICTFFCIGGTIRQRGRNGPTNYQGDGAGSNNYQGYAITAGRFLSNSRQGTA